MMHFLGCVQLLLLLSLELAASVDQHAILEYKFDMGAPYGLNGRTEISHDNLQSIIKGAQKGNKGICLPYNLSRGYWFFPD